MIKVGFITTPLTDSNSIRGVGFYTRRLLPELKRQAPSFGFEILEIENSFQISNFKLQIIHYPYFDLFKHTLPIFKKTKTIITIHDVIPLEFPDHYPPGKKGWLNLQLQKLALRSVERVLTDSYASVKTIHKFLQVPHHKLKLVYLAADPIFKKISSPKNKYKLPKKFVLYVGDINYNKNIPSLVAACQLAKLPLVIVGKQAADVEKMDLSHPELTHLKGVDWSGVTKLGFIPDKYLVDVYNLATVYCQPSLAEGFGLPVLEALACGTPLACSNTSSLPELAGDAATYFDPHDVAAISKAIQSTKDKDGVAQSAKFNWTKTASQALQVYQETLNMYQTGT